ncbi:dihydrofolate synthetase isoform X1 [Hordeum vulgare subsp. vulgare]|uniref:Mur ligase central domain-containing protein n=1 Tax=Hordeum vulgare subsp. vulgare TaxID=112509 RepID=A0A8I6XHI2_HORVV|nr:dihydrofolate synthetase isoform X1 [Hordeum vulgare subsp. vulgare]
MVSRFPVPFRWSRGLLRASSCCSRGISAMAGGEEAQLGGFLDYMDVLRNYERSGVPRGAGTDSGDGFDLGRMRRLLRRLGDPHTHYPSVHIAGTKGKGSTAAFLTNIMREQGYNVGCYSSPHLLTIRERISVGRHGGPVSAASLRDLFDLAKEAIDESIESENGSLTHFEVFTALSFLLFSRENVDVAIVEAGLGGARDATNVIRNSELAAAIITTVGKEHLAALGGSLQSIAVAKSGIIKEGRPVVIGGPFSTDIEQIIRDRAFLTQSPVISACDTGVRSITRCIGRDYAKPYQSCDIVVKISGDMPLSVELHDVKLQLLGDHQRQNAVMASCTALCLRELGWNVSDASIRAGLEKTQLPGRSQFLTQDEASVLGLDGAAILIDGAHTEASAKALSDVIKTVEPEGPVALIVGMASDKEHLAFAAQLLSGRRPDVVLLTETGIAGGTARSMPASSLRDIWTGAALGQGIECADIGAIAGDEAPTVNIDHLAPAAGTDKPGLMLIGCGATPFSRDLMKAASQLLRRADGPGAARGGGLICVTGSMHMVASVLQQLEQ